MRVSTTRYLQGAAYVMAIAIFIFVMGITRNCGRLPVAAIEGHSGGDTLDIALLYGPGSIYHYADTLSGINYEIAQKFSKDTGRPIKIWPISDAAAGMGKLDKGAFDIVASLPLDNYIKERYQTSESVFLDRLVLVELNDSAHKPVASSLELNGKTVYVSPGSSALKRLENLSEEIGGKINVVEGENLSDELLAIKVATGGLPLAVVNERVAKRVAESYPDLSYDNTVSFTQFQVWIFDKEDTEAYNKFNEWFGGFKETEDYREIVGKY